MKLYPDKQGAHIEGFHDSHIEGFHRNLIIIIIYKTTVIGSRYGINSYTKASALPKHVVLFIVNFSGLCKYQNCLLGFVVQE